MVYFDENHWVKAGIEIIDDMPRLSCVVTNDMSDFSLQNWKETSLRIRITQKGNGSYVVEAHLMPDEDDSKEESGYSFIRIAQLQIDVSSQVKLGVYGCCPFE